VFLFFRIFTFLNTNANPFYGHCVDQFSLNHTQLPKNAAQREKTL